LLVCVCKNNICCKIILYSYIYTACQGVGCVVIFEVKSSLNYYNICIIFEIKSSLNYCNIYIIFEIKGSLNYCNIYIIFEIKSFKLFLKLKVL